MNLEKTTVIIPTLNEAEGIGPTITEVLKEVDDPRIIVIDANSVDETREIAAELGATVLRQSGSGKGDAVAQALRHVPKDTKWLAMTDGDYTYPFSIVPSVIRLMKGRPDVAMVTGNKSHKPRTFQAHLKKLLTDRYYLEDQVFTLLHRLLNGAHMQDPFTGLRVIRYECIKDFQPKARKFDIEVEINHYILKTTRSKVIEVPITLRKRLGGSKYSFSDSFEIFHRMVVMALGDIVANPFSSRTIEAKRL